MAHEWGRKVKSMVYNPSDKHAQCIYNNQIQERSDSAIVYDPTCKYVECLYDKDEEEIVLNPLDARCPYWSPTR